MNNPAGVVDRRALPDDTFKHAWSAIKLDDGVHSRLLAQALLSLTVRQRLPFEDAPLHGLILLTGVPGTGKTSLARGLADQVSRHLAGTKTTFVEIDPHALTSAALGRSQQAVTKLFDQTLPELAHDGVLIVLLDEVETLAASRHRLSLETNPIDVHRATDAALAGIDRLTRDHRNIIAIATTNFPEAIDSAMLSRADHVEEIGLPGDVARRTIIADTLDSISTVWKNAGALRRHEERLAQAARGLDGRRIRKGIFAAMASDLETAKDPNRLSVGQVESSLRQMATLGKGGDR